MIRLLDGETARYNDINHQATRSTFDKYYTITVRWIVVDELTNIRFIFNKTSTEPLENMVPPHGTLALAGMLDMGSYSKYHNMWHVLHGNAGDRLVEIDTLRGLLKPTPNHPLIGTPLAYTNDHWCALNAYANASNMQVDAYEALKKLLLREHPQEEDTPLNVLARIVNRLPGLHRLQRADLNEESCSSRARLTEMLELAARGGVPLTERDGPHTGVYIFPVWNHVIALDTRSGVIYDPDPRIAKLLPATEAAANALGFANDYDWMGRAYVILKPRVTEKRKMKKKRKKIIE